MSEQIVIIGSTSDGKLIAEKLAQLASKQEVIIVTPEEVNDRGLEIVTKEDMKKNMDEMVTKIELIEREELFKPKKVHPKHQKNNKYRLK